MGKNTVVEFASAQILEALANPLRIRILKALLEKRYCQCDLAAKFEEHPVNISRHLAVLSRAGLVLIVKEGNKTFPELVHPQVAEILKITEFIIHKTASKKAREAASLKAALS